MKSIWKISPAWSIGLSDARQSMFWVEGRPRGVRIPFIHSEAVKLGELDICKDRVEGWRRSRRNAGVTVLDIASCTYEYHQYILDIITRRAAYCEFVNRLLDDQQKSSNCHTWIVSCSYLSCMACHCVVGLLKVTSLPNCNSAHCTGQTSTSGGRDATGRQSRLEVCWYGCRCRIHLQWGARKISHQCYNGCDYAISNYINAIMAVCTMMILTWLYG